MTDTCQRCDGCGKIADTDDGEPWTQWMGLPVESAAAVLMGIVKPIPCPACGGSGDAAATTPTVKDLRNAAPRMALLLRNIAAELQRTVDEDGQVLHLNRSNDIYMMLQDVYGDDYWEKNPLPDVAPHIVVRVLKEDR